MTTSVLASRPSQLFRTESEVMNTIPDPRTPSPSSALSRSASTSSDPHPDLSNEVATLSTKLINAINHQTNLDDSLQATRHELEAARERIAQLEAAANAHEHAISWGLLLRREDVDKKENQLRGELAEERRLRSVAEKEKKGMEQELENLTTALFEEANTMVAAARKEKEASDRRIEQLKKQLNDAELLLASHQEQLQDLKTVMQQMSSDRDENETNTHISTAPSTPGVAAPDKMSRVFEAANLTPNTPSIDDIPPNYPLHFSHLIRPALRTDLDAYEDFQLMLKTARAAAPQSRLPSGSFSGLNVMGLGSSSSTPNLTHNPSNGSTTSLPGPTPPTPNLPGTFNVASSARDSGSSALSLKDSKVYKRALAEDIEPTLRLDAAPGLSWLARRTVLNAITSGSLVVEPLPPSTSRFYGPIFACALCGEHRKGEQYACKHRFRTSEAEDAQRYPLCEYCLGRVRATCDYIGFLRMVSQGLWRGDTQEEGRAAWEESVRLRERMFWTRIGGGVVPVFVRTTDSPAPVNGKADERNSEDSVDLRGERKSEDPFQSGDESRTKRISIGRTLISQPNDGPSRDVLKGGAEIDELDAKMEREIEEQAAEQLQNEAHNSMTSTSGDQATATSAHDTELVGAASEKQQSKTEDKPVTKEDPRLSITIPGAFE